jgi:prepilin-type N-terminal cleavage/methylation domain-containing protein
MRRIRLGLSLVEVLVAIAIVLVLSAIVLGAVANSKGHARTVECSSNIRQLAVSLELYRHDGDKTMPENLYHDFTALLPYVQDKRLLACPSDPFGRGANAQAARNTGHRISYFAPLTISPRFMRHLPASDSNHGVFACLIHGETWEPLPEYSPVMDYRGLVLTARLDSSVHRRQVHPRCFMGDDGTVSRARMYWDFFTDAPMPMDVQNVLLTEPDAREVPCSEFGFR